MQVETSTQGEVLCAAGCTASCFVEPLLTYSILSVSTVITS